jgi:hypothetical protein
MQLPKVVLSWLGAILGALTALIALVNGVFTNPAATSPLVMKILGAATIVVTVIRNLLKDFGGSSDPIVQAAAAAGQQAGAVAGQKIAASQ